QKLPAGSFDLPIYDKYTTSYPSEHNSIQPRVGVAWNIAKNTGIRVNAGILVAKTEGHNVKNAFSGAGETPTNLAIAQTTSGGGAVDGPRAPAPRRGGGGGGRGVRPPPPRHYARGFTIHIAVPRCLLLPAERRTDIALSVGRSFASA